MKNFVLSIAVSSLLLTGCSDSKKEESEKDPAAQEAATPEKNTSDQKEYAMYKVLSSYIQSAEAEMEAIASERKEELKKIADFVKTKKDSNKTANLTFICTHNSRRSHMSQIWAAAAAAHYGIEENVNTYSGGTEATAFNPRAVAAIERAGFKVVNPQEAEDYGKEFWVELDTGSCSLALHAGGKRRFGEDAPKFVFRVQTHATGIGGGLSQTYGQPVDHRHHRRAQQELVPRFQDQRVT